MQKIKIYLHMIVLIGLFISSISSYKVFGNENDVIRITIDGKSLNSDVAPRIIKDRTMIPFRVVFEALGAEVIWDDEKQLVTGKMDNTTVILEVDQFNATVNGVNNYLDVSPVIIDDRVLVPVRFVAESLGATVNWLGEERTVEILTNTTFTNDLTGATLKYGMTRDELIRVLGEPQRKDLSEYGFYWYIYKNDYSNYIQVGVDENKVVAFSVFSKNWVIDEVKGIQVGKLKSEIPNYALTSSLNVRLYFDKYKEGSLQDVALLAFEYIPESMRKNINYSSEVIRGWEKQIFDQTNALRVIKAGLTPFIWSDQASASSRDHSKDMAINNYFNHKSLSGLLPWDRMEAKGINAKAQAENIAAGYYSSTAVTIAWWNSLDHRANMLGDYINLGVGAHYYEKSTYKTYFTQDFFTSK